MSIVCVIPARYNSSRFPGKLLAKAGGKTILQRTFESAARCPEIDALYVATDSEEIGDHILALGGNVLWTSSVPRDGTERIIEALHNHAPLQKASYILNLQGDHPCTPPETVRKIVETLRSDPTAVLSTAASPIRDGAEFASPHVVKCVFDQQGNALYFSRSPIPYRSKPGAPIFAFAHIGIYCYRLEFLKGLAAFKSTPLQENEDLEQLRVLEQGYRIKIAVVDEKAPSVDTPEDLTKLEEYLLCPSNISL